MNAVIRKMTYGDLDEIVAIEQECFSMPWSKESFTKELLNPMARYICAEIDGSIAGYVGVWKILDEGHITNVAVREKYRRLGIGSKLIVGILNTCAQLDIANVTLEVRESNEGAIRLYEKHGFQSAGKRPGYYRKPVEAAIIMWHTLKQPDEGSAKNEQKKEF